MLLRSEPWWTVPAAAFYVPVQDGTSTLTTPSSKTRTHHFAGKPEGLVDSGTWCAGTLNWGTSPTESPANTAVAGTPTNIESGAGGNAHVRYVQNSDGSQSYAMGRIIKYPDGRLEMTQYKDDQLYSDHPRCQLYAWHLNNLSGYWRQYAWVEFGDNVIPWPSYANNTTTDGILFYQLKALPHQPVLQLFAKWNATDRTKLDIQYNIKTSNSGIVEVAHTISGVEPKGIHKFCIDTYLDWKDRGAEGGKAYTGLWYNNQLVYSSTDHNLMDDEADIVQPMWGIYRPEWDTKATDDCRVIFHLAGIKNANRSLEEKLTGIRPSRE